MIYYNYNCTWWDDSEEENNTIKGIVAASNLSNAIEHITNYYGEDNILEVKIHYITDDELLEGVDYAE